MAAEAGLLGLYWGARQEPIESCARCVYESLRVLTALGYERYFLHGRSRHDALKGEFLVTPEAVLTTLAKGANHSEIPRKPIPELGWRMGLWSGGADEESYSVDFHCGAYSEYVGNSVVMTLPKAGPHRIGAAPEGALKAYEALFAIWKPEQAILCEGSIDWDDHHRIVPECTPLARYPARQSARKS